MWEQVYSTLGIIIGNSSQVCYVGDYEGEPVMFLNIFF